MLGPSWRWRFGFRVLTSCRAERRVQQVKGILKGSVSDFFSVRGSLVEGDGSRYVWLQGVGCH